MKKRTPNHLNFSKSSLLPKVGSTALGVFAFLIASVQSQAASQIIYSDNFSDGNRDGWYNSNASGGLVVDNGQLKSINTTSRFLTYFSPTSLEVGESMTVSFDLEMASVGDSNYGFRIGILDSEGLSNQVSADDYGDTNALFNNYSGYRLNTNLGADTSNITTFAGRTGVSDDLLGSTSMTSVSGSGTANGVKIEAETSYPTSFTFLRTDTDTLSLSFSMNGIVLSTQDSPANTFTFDTLAFYRKQDAGGDIFLDNVEVSYDGIPEPGQASMIFGAIAAAVIMIRRRRR
ncbi:hypothetical protein [Puniceicoccus vermicola]|uniref:PEP-CTERM sorting domain-containing protein n=1 Tax=Puniceicoccus vermicola TaxID=388746 RepID=A0A7X1AXW1_9BACT|nr:hypothetical protein [Puniceicoccus vermicola]MBC2601794.1 hypothetical protein [Puniceicoccus vermicola]